MKKLNLIEPTLHDQTGHAYSYTSSLINANTNFGLNIDIWIDKRAKSLFSKKKCTTHLYFSRRIRRIQKFFLYRKLVSSPDSIFICTAEWLDLVILNFLNKKSISNNTKIFLHFHQFTLKKNRLDKLKKIANNNPNFIILAPTTRLIDIFKTAGFKNCHALGCPSFIPQVKQQLNATNFEKILYAGAARNDKGFSRIIDLLLFFRNNGDNTHFSIQISPPHSSQHDPQTQEALDRLKLAPKHNLTLHKETLDYKDYQQLFMNSICLLIYDESYQNKFSGIALDAFYAGCPIVTITNTWMADTVQRFNAGVTITNHSCHNITVAINTIKNNYSEFHNNAKLAAKTLFKEHDPKHTLELIVA
jgi:glycosyltransferase involved in cell wall biosynthesis